MDKLYEHERPLAIQPSDLLEEWFRNFTGQSAGDVCAVFYAELNRLLRWLIKTPEQIDYHDTADCSLHGRVAWEQDIAERKKLITRLGKIVAREVLKTGGDVHAFTFVVICAGSGFDPSVREVEQEVKRIHADLVARRIESECYSPSGKQLATAASSGEPKEPPVVLGAFGDNAWVLGRPKPALSAARYATVKALLKAGQSGLTKDQLDRAAGRADARKLLQRLVKSDPDWAKVIHMPQKSGMRYRIS